MQELSFESQIVLYVLLMVIGFFTMIIWWGQFGTLRGKSFKNPDGTTDDWHKQKNYYGIAFADVFLACPASIAGIILIFIYPRWGYFLLALVSFWLLWANIMTTVTSLRFENPKISLMWIITFPLGAVVGLTYIIWTIINFNVIFH